MHPIHWCKHEYNKNTNKYYNGFLCTWAQANTITEHTWQIGQRLTETTLKQY